MTTGEFWQRQEFDYIETYSFNRGPKLDALRIAAKAWFQLTREQLLTCSTTQLPELRERLHLLERTHNLDLLTLTQGDTAFHITAEPISRIEKNDLVAQGLAAILQTPVMEQMNWMCAPIYRDAVAFYNAQNNLASVLNICFSCDRMVTANGQEIQADTVTYQVLREYLIQLGHPIMVGER